MTRHARRNNNLLILAKIKEFIDKNPDLRFHQVLWALDLESKTEDKFHEEPDMTYEKLLNKLKEIK